MRFAPLGGTRLCPADEGGQRGITVRAKCGELAYEPKRILSQKVLVMSIKMGRTPYTQQQTVNGGTMDGVMCEGVDMTQRCLSFARTSPAAVHSFAPSVARVPDKRQTSALPGEI